MDIHLLPKLNATLNGLAGFFLILGWFAIKRKNQTWHRNFMLSALAVSTAFLVSYVTYHFLHPGVTRYPGQGFARPIYFFILLTHAPLAVLVVPMSLRAIYFAVKKDFTRHTRITRWLFPIWVYVSLTGILIYLMLYVL